MRFSLAEFRRCVRAILAFAGGYKLGEDYLLGRLEAKRSRSLDPEAWQLGYNLSRKRNPYRGGLKL